MTSFYIQKYNHTPNPDNITQSEQIPIHNVGQVMHIMKVALVNILRYLYIDYETIEMYFSFV